MLIKAIFARGGGRKCEVMLTILHKGKIAFYLQYNPFDAHSNEYHMPRNRFSATYFIDSKQTWLEPS